MAALILLPLLALVAARVLKLDDRSGRVFAVQTLAPVVLLPAYAVGVAACIARRWLIGTVAVLLAITHLAWISPLPLAGRSVEASSGPAFTLVSANVAADNAAPEDVAAALVDTRADVVVLAELTPAFDIALDKSGFSERYPNRIVDARAGFFGSGIYSRVPIADSQRVEIGGLPTVRATLRFGETRVGLVAIHTIQPLADLGTLRRQHAELGELAASTKGPLIVAGDFNATTQHRPFRQLLESRLRDSHAERGRIFARTWPAEPAPPAVCAVGPRARLRGGRGPRGRRVSHPAQRSPWSPRGVAAAIGAPREAMARA